MKLEAIGDGYVRVTLNEEECDLIADGCQDASTRENPSISGDLSRNFKAMSTVLEMNRRGML